MIFKLTDQNARTQGDMQWGDNVTHSADLSAPPALCSRGVIHGYRSPLLAVLLNPIHANFDAPRLWRASGEIVADDGLKIGCRTLTTIEEMPLPDVSDTQRVAFGILCALEVCREPAFVAWAEKWLSGEDRTADAARAAWAAVAARAAAAARAAEAAAAWAEAAAAWAAWAAARAAWAAARAARKIDFVALAERAVKCA